MFSFAHIIILVLSAATGLHNITPLLFCALFKVKDSVAAYLYIAIKMLLKMSGSQCYGSMSLPAVVYATYPHSCPFLILTKHSAGDTTAVKPPCNTFHTMSFNLKLHRNWYYAIKSENTSPIYPLEGSNQLQWLTLGSLFSVK